MKSLVKASKNLSENLLKFSKEAGKNLEAGKTFSKILAFALSSRIKTGKNFYYKKLPTLPFGDVLLQTFKPPARLISYL